MPRLGVVRRSFLARHPAEVAPDLLGAVIVSDVDGARVAVRLTEVEAYDGANDPGSHAYRGRTARNAVMFGPAGHLYVYFTYGMHYCANVVCGWEGAASGLLLRAGEVVAGAGTARERRQLPGGRSPRDRDLARGPARLATALGIDRAHGGIDLLDTGSAVRLHSAGDLVLLAGRPAGEAVADTAASPGAVASGPRVGVRGAGGDDASFPWRFWLVGDPTVSPYRAAVPLRRRS